MRLTGIHDEEGRQWSSKGGIGNNPRLMRGGRQVR